MTPTSIDPVRTRVGDRLLGLSALTVLVLSRIAEVAQTRTRLGTPGRVSLALDHHTFANAHGRGQS